MIDNILVALDAAEAAPSAEAIATLREELTKFLADGDMMLRAVVDNNPNKVFVTIKFEEKGSYQFTAYTADETKITNALLALSSKINAAN